MGKTFFPPRPSPLMGNGAVPFPYRKINLPPFNISLPPLPPPPPFPITSVHSINVRSWHMISCSSPSSLSRLFLSLFLNPLFLSGKRVRGIIIIKSIYVFKFGSHRPLFSLELQKTTHELPALLYDSLILLKRIEDFQG